MQFVGANWLRAVIVLLPPLPPTAAVVVEGFESRVVTGAAAAVVTGVSGGAYACVEVADVTTGARLLDAETVGELTLAAAEVDAAAVAAVVATATEATGAVPREGVAWQVAERDRAKLFKPSACRGSEGPAGRVPT